MIQLLFGLYLMVNFTISIGILFIGALNPSIYTNPHFGLIYNNFNVIYVIFHLLNIISTAVVIKYFIKYVKIKP